jgi:Ca-activated chloride channel family protein
VASDIAVTGLSFAYPGVLALASILVPLVGWAFVRGWRRRRKALSAFGDERLLAIGSVLPSARARLTGHALQLGAVTFGLVALARPQLGDRAASLAHSGRDVLVLLDLSRSMNAADDSLSRLVIAKDVIARVLAAVPEHRAGLVVFGGSAFLQLPLTENHAAFRRFLDAASTDDLGDPATDLSNALSAAATAFEHEGERGYQSILIASDGESVSGDVAPPLMRLKKAGIPVFSIGLGSPQGSPIPADSAAAPEKWHHDHIGRVVLSRLDEGDLRRAARETGGLYVRATPAAVQHLAAELARMETRRLSSRESTERIDRFQWPLALALLALAVAPVATGSGRGKRR